MTTVNLKVSSFKHRVEYLVKAMKMMFTGRIQFEYSVIDKSKTSPVDTTKTYHPFTKDIKIDKKFKDVFGEIRNFQDRFK